MPAAPIPPQNHSTGLRAPFQFNFKPNSSPQRTLQSSGFLCGLHELYSHIMVSLDFFLYLFISFFLSFFLSLFIYLFVYESCARGFALLHWFNIRYGLYCFVFYGCIVVYPVPHKSVLTGKLIWPMVCTYKFRSTSMSHTR